MYGCGVESYSAACTGAYACDDGEEGLGCGGHVVAEVCRKVDETGRHGRRWSWHELVDVNFLYTRRRAVQDEDHQHVERHGGLKSYIPPYMP